MNRVKTAIGPMMRGRGTASTAGSDADRLAALNALARLGQEIGIG